MPNLKQAVILILAGVGGMLFTVNAMADDTDLTVSLSAREEYDDTVAGSKNQDRIDDFILTLTPGLKLARRTERVDVNASANVSSYYYKDNDTLDHVDQSYQGNGLYQVNEVAGISATALYDVSNRPDRDIITTGLLVSDERRILQAYGLGCDYTLTETSALAFSGGYGTEKWQGRNTENEDLETYHAVLTVSHNLSRWSDPTTGRLNFGYKNYDYETSDIDYYFATLGLQHGFTETLNLTVDLGARYVDTNYLTSQAVFVPPATYLVESMETNEQSVGGVGSANLEINGELTRASIRIAHDVSSASSRGTTVARTDAVLAFSRRLGERSAASISTGYFKNRAEAGKYSSSEIDENTFFVHPRMRWALYEKFILEAGYDFTYTVDHVKDDDFERNRFYLQVSYGIPLFE